MLNHITTMGRLVRDPELRRTQAGIPVTSFTIACDRDYKAADGEKATDFIDVVAWRSTAEFVCKYLSKGRMVVVDGRLQLRDWTDRDGNKRRSAEIVASSVNFGDSRPQNQAAPAQAYADRGAAPAAGYPGGNAPVAAYPDRSATPAPAYSGSAAPRGGWQEIDDSDSDLPF